MILLGLVNSHTVNSKGQIILSNYFNHSSGAYIKQNSTGEGGGWPLGNEDAEEKDSNVDKKNCNKKRGKMP